MSRAIALPSIGDPFLLNLWFKYSYPNFENEVDHVYLVIDRAFPCDYLINKYNTPKISAKYSENAGLVSVIQGSYEACKETHFGFIQDDAFVFRKGEVERCFKYIEDGKYDVVASPVYCYSAELVPILFELFKSTDDFLKEMGYAFWQNFFFTSKEAIQQTDGNFNVQEWEQGKYIDYLKATMPSNIHLEMFTGISFQLRTLGKRIKYVAQSLTLWESSFYPLDVNFWHHVNSLSSIMVHMGNVDKMPPLPITGALRIELERRVSWWQFAIDVFPKEDIPLVKSLYYNYNTTIDEFIERYKLNQDNIDKRKKIIARLFSIN